MFGVSKEQFLSFVRHVVTFVGGIVVAKGGLDPAALESIAGIVVTVAGLVWSFTAPEKELAAEVRAANKAATDPPPPQG